MRFPNHRILVQEHKDVKNYHQPLISDKHIDVHFLYYAVYLIMEDGFTVEKISEALNISKTILEKLTDMRFQSSKVNLKIV